MKTSVLLGAALAFGAPLVAQEAEADSVKLHEEAIDIQRRFEVYREERMIPELDQSVPSCDERIGRWCVVYDDSMFEFEPQQEPVEFGMAREKVLSDLRDLAKKIPGDLWILQTRIYYMGEIGQWRQAESLARDCGGGEHWWCRALLGYVQHKSGDWGAAEATFARVMSRMPPEELEAWLSGHLFLDSKSQKVLDNAPDHSTWWNRFWLLADPLYLVPGNDRETEQYSRNVYAKIFREAFSPGGMEWGDDTEEIKLRGGPTDQYRRVKGVGAGLSLNDTRGLWNIGDPRSGSFVPTADGIESPSDVAPGSWRSDNYRTLTKYLPPYAANMHQLEVQVARFRRGDSMLVVGAFTEEDPMRRSQAKGPQRITMRRPVINMRAPQNEDRADRQRRVSNPFAREEEIPQPMIEEEVVDGPPAVSGMILIDEETFERHEVTGEGPTATYSIQVPNGRYIMSSEAWQEQSSSGWRSRHGVWQDDLVFGLAGLSDLIVLRDTEELPESLEEALPNVMPVVRISSGEAFQVGWELYGLEIAEVATLRIGVDKVEEGALRRLGQFLRMLEPNDPIDLTFQDQAPDVLGTVFRSVRLNLPDLEPGDYTITVEVILPGREPMSTTRTLEIAQ